MKRRSIGITKRQKLFKQQKGKCFYCNISFKENDKKKKATIEHRIPFVKSGNNKNLCLTCFQCNNLKGDISEKLFLDGYVCYNIKPGFNLKSYNKPVKVRNKINWFQKTFPSLFWWNKGIKIKSIWTAR